MIKFCFFGHIDSGKSTTAGHLLYKTKCISQREYDKIFNECKQAGKLYQLYSRILDITEEEFHKGKTYEYTIIDLNFNDKSFQIELLWGWSIVGLVRGNMVFFIPLPLC